MSRRKRPNWPLRLLVCAILVALSAQVLVGPVIQWSSESLPSANTTKWLDEFRFAEQIKTRALEVIATLWIFAFGASLGSFLNVVVYRLPNNKPLTGSSKCPYCAVPIRFRDNIPVFGWIILRGRCRTCRLPISPRYPIVEGVMGAIFVSLFFVELWSGGANLPMRTPDMYGGFDLVIFRPQWDLIRLYLFHCWLMSILLGATLITLDGHHLPKRLTTFALAISFMMPAIWPDLHPMEWVLQRPGWLSVGGLLRIDTSVVGLVCGTILGCAITTIAKRSQSIDGNHPTGWLGMTFGFALIGLCLGWQATVCVAAVALSCHVANFGCSRLGTNSVRIPGLAYVTAATFIQLCLWRALTRLIWPT